MARKETTVVEVICDWCGRDMSHEKYGAFVRGLNFFKEGIDPSGSSGLKISYPDLCKECSGEFMEFIKSRKAK